MIGCLDAELLSDWVAGTLTDDVRARAVSHIATCAACREAISALARAAPTADGERALDPRAEASGWVPGATLGRYVIADVVAHGGMGVVLVADDPTLRRKVAIKVRRPGTLLQAGLDARLVEEARALAQLRHPNIVAVFDAGQDGDQLFLVMELVDGESMRDWLDRRPPWRDALRVCLAFGRGLEAMHRAGLAHRDIKPGNVLISQDGRVLLADLGLVVRTDGTAGPGLTAHGAVVGTPRYIAPEQLAGERGDARSDQYSYAITLREALEAEQQPLPQALRAVIQRAMDPDPPRRFPSMTELLAAAEAAARPAGRSSRTRVVLGVAALATAAVAAVTAIVAGRVAPVARAPAAESGSGAAAQPPSAATPVPGATSAAAPLPAAATGASPGSGVRHDPRGSAYDLDLGAASVHFPRTRADAIHRADYDPKHFDPSRYLAVAADLAHSLIPDAEFAFLSFVAVESDGRVNVELCEGHCMYHFRSQSLSRLPAGVPRNVRPRLRCSVRVNVEPERIVASVQDDPSCENPVGPLPRCTLAQIWARAIARKAPRDLGAKLWWRPNKGWDFTIELGHDRRFDLRLKDDC